MSAVWGGTQKSQLIEEGCQKRVVIGNAWKGTLSNLMFKKIEIFQNIERYKETMWIKITVFSSWACSKLLKYVIVNF